MNAGLQFTYQFTQPAIGLFLGFDFVTCTYKKSVQSGIKDMFQDSGLPDADYRFPRYNNLPLSAGISIYSPLHGKVSIHTDCGIVLNSLSISDFIVSAYGQSIEVSTDWTHAIGYRFGMGLIFNDEVTLAADYFGLGSHDISVKTKTPVSTENSEGRQRIEMINITMGLSF